MAYEPPFMGRGDYDPGYRKKAPRSGPRPYDPPPSTFESKYRDFSSKVKNIMDDPKAAWNKVAQSSDDLGLRAIGLKPGSNPSGFTRFGAGLKTGLDLRGLGGALNVAGAGLAGWGAYSAAREREEQVDDALVRAGAEGVGSFFGGGAGLALGALAGPAAPIAMPLLGIAGSVIGSKGLGAISESLYDMTPFGEKALTPEEAALKKQEEEWQHQLGRAEELARMQLELGKEGALFEEVIAQRAYQDLYEKEMALQTLADLNLQQRQLLSDTMASFDNSNAANKQFLAALYG